MSRTALTTRIGTLILAASLVLAGCSSVVSGSGRAARPSASSPARPTACPHVVYPAAKLVFTCLTSGMRAEYTGPVWPVRETKVVETSTDWVLEEGAGHWGSNNGSTLAAIAADVRQQMISTGGYGDNPSVRTVASRKTTIDGTSAYLLQTTVTINPAWARTYRTKVSQERLWIVAIEVRSGDVSLWYASIPDLAKQLWPDIAHAIASIKVG